HFTPAVGGLSVTPDVWASDDGKTEDDRHQWKIAVPPTFPATHDRYCNQAITLTIPQIRRLPPITCAMAMLRQLSPVTIVSHSYQSSYGPHLEGRYRSLHRTRHTVSYPAQ